MMGRKSGTTKGDYARLGTSKFKLLDLKVLIYIHTVVSRASVIPVQAPTMHVVNPKVGPLSSHSCNCSDALWAT